jgi:hypothetical protein
MGRLTPIAELELVRQVVPGAGQPGYEPCRRRPLESRRTGSNAVRDRYVEAIRLVGSKFLAAGEIPTAWAYFRVIAEPGPVKAALDEYEPDQDAEGWGRSSTPPSTRVPTPGEGSS